MRAGRTRTFAGSLWLAILAGCTGPQCDRRKDLVDSSPGRRAVGVGVEKNQSKSTAAPVFLQTAFVSANNGLDEETQRPFPLIRGQDVALRPQKDSSSSKPSLPGKVGADSRPVCLAALTGVQLRLDSLVELVLARNPTLAQMTAASAAAAARFPQVTSLEDPNLVLSIGPASIGSRDVSTAYRVEVSQKFPYPGKLELRGRVAQAEAAAAGREVEDMRLQLVESIADAFFDLFLADRSLEVNVEGKRLVESFRSTAESRYSTGKFPQQDVLQADVEVARQDERRIALERMRNVAAARINTLLHLPVDAPLPPPPKEIKIVDDLPAAELLRTQALARRPDLQALSDRIRGDESSLELAYKDFKPDFEAMAAYDNFWQPENQRDLRPMIGVRMNLPTRQAKRCATVAEMHARLAGRKAELARLGDQLQFQVQQAIEQVRESEKTARLYESTLLPTAERNVKVAQSEYIAGVVSFLALVEAQRSLIELRDKYYESLANYFRRRATLERVVGGPLPSSEPSTAGVHPERRN